MKFSNRYWVFILAAVIFAIGASILSTGVGAQEEGWQIVRAEYGHRNQVTDVTDILRDLAGRGGVNGRVAVNNQTMGGDPAPGRDKALRIIARNRRNEEREFTYNEGGFVEARMFNVRRDDRDDWDARPGNSGGRDRDDWTGLRIIRAYYGGQGRTGKVHEYLRSRVGDCPLSCVVTNEALGSDPAPGADKVLIVVYRYQGNETATAVREGVTLPIP